MRMGALPYERKILPNFSRYVMFKVKVRLFKNAPIKLKPGGADEWSMKQVSML